MSYLKLTQIASFNNKNSNILEVPSNSPRG